jgi:hypothetical protein
VVGAGATKILSIRLGMLTLLTKSIPAAVILGPINS